VPGTDYPQLPGVFWEGEWLTRAFAGSYVSVEGEIQQLMGYMIVPLNTRKLRLVVSCHNLQIFVRGYGSLSLGHLYGRGFFAPIGVNPL